MTGLATSSTRTMRGRLGSRISLSKVSGNEQLQRGNWRTPPKPTIRHNGGRSQARILGRNRGRSRPARTQVAAEQYDLARPHRRPLSLRSGLAERDRRHRRTVDTRELYSSTLHSNAESWKSGTCPSTPAVVKRVSAAPKRGTRSSSTV
jgi:hypothetical protein